MNNFTFYAPTLFAFGDGEEKNRPAMQALNNLLARWKKEGDK